MVNKEQRLSSLLFVLLYWFSYGIGTCRDLEREAKQVSERFDNVKYGRTNGKDCSDGHIVNEVDSFITLLPKLPPRNRGIKQGGDVSGKCLIVRKDRDGADGRNEGHEL